ncbi:hypothetical protein ABT245_33650, partial [Streptomyces sp. NPDC001508]
PAPAPPATSPCPTPEPDTDQPEPHRPNGALLGADEALWDDRFVGYLYDDPGERGTVWLRLTPVSLTAQDLSYTVVPS